MRSEAEAYARRVKADAYAAGVRASAEAEAEQIRAEAVAYQDAALQEAGRVQANARRRAALIVAKAEDYRVKWWEMR